MKKEKEKKSNRGGVDQSDRGKLISRLIIDRVVCREILFERSCFIRVPSIHRTLWYCRKVICTNRFLGIVEARLYPSSVHSALDVFLRYYIYLPTGLYVRHITEQSSVKIFSSFYNIPSIKDEGQ